MDIERERIFVSSLGDWKKEDAFINKSYIRSKFGFKNYNLDFRMCLLIFSKDNK